VGTEQPSIAAVIEAPAAGELPALQRVQDAIAEDVRQRLREVAGIARDGRRPRLRFAPGAGALLTAPLAGALTTALLANQDEVALPLDGAALRRLPCNAGTCFAAVDGADLLALSLHPDAGLAARQALAELPIDARRMAAALCHFANRDSEITVCGPIRSRNWQYIEEQVACRARVFADGSAERAGLATMLFSRTPPHQLADWLRAMGNAAFLDSRQLLAGSAQPSGDDFFWSDLGRPDAVRHADLRRLTEMALSTDFPIILGGPGLVNGTLYALVETAWRTGPDVDRGYHIAW